MESKSVMIFGNILAIQAEIEAMKAANYDSNLSGWNKYTETDFFSKAEELRSATNELFK